MVEALKEKQQHFLINENILDKEIDTANLTIKDEVIEIGFGNGTLTRKLSERAGRVRSFEIDKRFKEQIEKGANLELIYDDAMKYSWRGFNKIVSNIPYSFSEQIVVKALKDEIDELTLIVGEKFKEKLVGETKIGIFARAFYLIAPIMPVGKENFSPQPRINSWLIKMIRLQKLNDKEKMFQKILISDGKIKNAIMYGLVGYGKTKNQARELIYEMNFSEQTLEKSMKKSTAKFLLNLKSKLKNLQ